MSSVFLQTQKRTYQAAATSHYFQECRASGRGSSRGADVAAICPFKAPERNPQQHLGPAPSCARNKMSFRSSLPTQVHLCCKQDRSAHSREALHNQGGSGQSSRQHHVSHLGSFMSNILLCADLLGGALATFISPTSVPVHEQDGAAQRNCWESSLSELYSFIPSTIFPANTRRVRLFPCPACRSAGTIATC